MDGARWLGRGGGTPAWTVPGGWAEAVPEPRWLDGGGAGGFVQVGGSGMGGAGKARDPGYFE
ncbi:hypothetical protein [Arthrobacter castelli]|uniref:hypothetical protein n=1 Tax=Arthrobacter castelli TaxID=271431 RepID=UPI0003FF7DA4|nr:hypothetical protein [Arthrobacter castelli]